MHARSKGAGGNAGGASDLIMRLGCAPASPLRDPQSREGQRRCAGEAAPPPFRGRFRRPNRSKVVSGCERHFFGVADRTLHKWSQDDLPCTPLTQIHMKNNIQASEAVLASAHVHTRPSKVGFFFENELFLSAAPYCISSTIYKTNH